MNALFAILGLARCLGALDEWDGLRSRIASAGDVNCDGTPDLLLADREAEIATVWVLDGRSGWPVLSVAGESPGDGFGQSLSSAGDLDGDGRADFIVGGWTPSETAFGYAGVFSGADGARLFRLTSGASGDGFGSCVTGGADLDGDGGKDLAVSSISSSYAFCGRSGNVLGMVEHKDNDWSSYPPALCLWQNRGVDPGAELILGCSLGLAEGRRGPALKQVRTFASKLSNCGGPLWAVAAEGDADGNGVRDLLVSFIHRGVAVVSGSTLEALHEIAPYQEASLVDKHAAGSTVDWIGDIDGDGGDDFVVAANESECILSPSPGFAHVYSGRTGELLRAYAPPQRRLDACRAGDVDRDGVPDLAVFVQEDRAVRVVSGRDFEPLWEVALEDLRR